MPRFKITLTKPPGLVNFNYQYGMLGYIHKVLKFNPYHGQSYSQFSFSNISNLRPIPGSGLVQSYFEPEFYFATWNPEILQRFAFGVKQGQEVVFGMTIKDMVIDEITTDKDIYAPQSPVFIKEPGTTNFLLFDDPRCPYRLKDILLKKMQAARVPVCDFEVGFLPTPTAKAKLITMQKQGLNIKIKASQCPVYIDAPAYIKHFIQEVGLGNSTGMGFGFVK